MAPGSCPKVRTRARPLHPCPSSLLAMGYSRGQLPVRGRFAGRTAVLALKKGPVWGILAQPFIHTDTEKASTGGKVHFQRHILFHRWSPTLSKPSSCRWRKKDSRWRWANTFSSSALWCPGWSGTLSPWPLPPRKTSLASISASWGTGRRDCSKLVAVISRSFKMPGNYRSEYKAPITKVHEFRKNVTLLAPESDETYVFYRELSRCSPFYTCAVLMHICINLLWNIKCLNQILIMDIPQCL